MSTKGIVGKKGHGKSLLALTQMLAHFSQGGFAASNLALDLDAVGRYCWKRRHRFQERQFRLLDLNRNPLFFEEIPRASVRLAKGRDVVRVYVDEAHLFFPSSRYRELSRDLDLLERWNSQCAKFGQELYLITQAWDNLWSNLRRQSIGRYHCRDMRQVKLPLVGQSLGNVIGLTWAFRDEETGEVLDRGNSRVTREVVDCYSREQIFDADMQALEGSIERFTACPDRIGLWQSLRKYPGTQPVEICSASSSSSLPSSEPSASESMPSTGSPQETA